MAAIEAERSEPVEGLRARVLAVDDDERNLLAIAEVLGEVGEVVCAQSGEEALRFLLKEDFAVILLDVLMPNLDGYETATLIRRRERSKNTPIIFLTAISKEEAHMLRGYDVGAVDYLFKPFDPVMLRSKVMVFVDLHEKTREIERNAAREQRLLEQALKAKSDKLDAERALRHSEARQEAILASLPICFHARSAEAPFAPSYVSKGVERLTGFPPSRFLSHPDFGLSRVHPDDREEVTRSLSAACETGSYGCEFRWRCANDEYRIFFDRGVVSKDDAGLELLGTMQDITEQRRLESQLLQSQRLDAIGKLTGGLAHDFNNLLAAILSGLSLLERQLTLDGNATKILDMTRRSAGQGRDLVQRMLAFSRRQDLKPVAVPLSSLGDTMNGLVAPVLGGLVRFKWLVSDDTWPVYVDAAQLELALMNLIFNARDAMPSGGTVLVRTSNRSVGHAGDELPAGDYVVVAVEDTGTGIAGDMISKVVEPFFTTKPIGKGTGLGLSTVYGFAKQSGGTLRIESEVDRGTIIELWLPRSNQPQDVTEAIAVAGAEAVEAVDAERATAVGERSLTVLLIDDSHSLREMTAMSLRQSGFEVVGASGGAEALAAIEREPDRFDVIVTDFAMPLISGIDVIRFARNLRAGWPAVMITGYADAEKIVERPLDVALVGKPFDEKDLVVAIHAAARGKLINASA
ncbi:response regulator [Mesorhizobium sp. M1A.F.Ca.IN.020.06.1.1]|uniref:response regulator n=1 Tax=unclassified Mesorhizobium TaxID=325217 RepID=UPI000BAF013A|nr:MULTISPECIES: response regulator [unclassified Mesorhizobium]PBB36369.1 hybrid sensor histidine kinase/response regulator [Mesorhizobium sp. WSM3882]RUV07859.1 response regulator [Mesorhizobium sp. M1A.F.Ca.IN.020.03.2.1]RUV85512.1 response regulator [Mesorhizobium sp. M1A.F.Ca.IN.020.32.1.1]RUW14886.1 response regulator [Mesorhizobium sp. M1A.F.Ca.IN.022.05.2.1]RUW33747.1 response regulator [Mesorhizobium sp. M1A.F.Ca.IN.020.06.1.1]